MLPLATINNRAPMAQPWDRRRRQRSEFTETIVSKQQPLTAADNDREPLDLPPLASSQEKQSRIYPARPPAASEQVEAADSLLSSGCNHDYANNKFHTPSPVAGDDGTQITTNSSSGDGCEPTTGAYDEYFSKQQEEEDLSSYGEENHPYVVQTISSSLSNAEKKSDEQQQQQQGRRRATISTLTEQETQPVSSGSAINPTLSGRNLVDANEGELEDCCYATGVNLRCKCAGTRRTTLAGLIELFEQGVTLGAPVSTRENTKNNNNINNNKPHQSRKDLISSSSCNHKPGGARTNTREGQMRNIITPVRYEPNENDDNEDDDEEEEESDSLEYIAEPNDPSPYQEPSNNNQPSSKSPTHRASIKGVPVLPTAAAATTRSQFRKLTATNWQPPTDGRKYDTITGPLFADYNCSWNSKGSSSRPSNYFNTTGTQQSVCFSDQEEGGEEYFKNRKSPAVANKTPSSSSAYLAATKGPAIIKHQASSSRRLLGQLARLRRLSEPNYRIKRPEKVAQVELLIEQLEQATADWEEDELLLDRAERRDLPLEYHRRFGEGWTKTRESTLDQSQRLKSLAADGDQRRRVDVHPFEEDTIARSHSLLSGIATGNPKTSTMTSTGSRTAKQSSQVGANVKANVDADGVQQRSATLGRKPRKPSGLADRYYDDLAVRRLAAHDRNQTPMTPSDLVPQMSYLLCSSAYTPSIEPAPGDARSGRRSVATSCGVGFLGSLDRRIRVDHDDLHYRSVRRKLAPHEPPFGIPRQAALASSHSSASHYLRRNQLNRLDDADDDDEDDNTDYPIIVCNCRQKLQSDQNMMRPRSASQRLRPDSKVSFLDDQLTSGFASADSGLAAAGSVETGGGRQSASSRLTPAPSGGFGSASGRQSRQQQTTEEEKEDTSPYHLNQQQQQQWYDEHDDLAKDVDLADELQDGCKWPHSPPPPPTSSVHEVQCDSPALERYRAQFGSTPTRRRPKIKIENPRAKSPLVRVSQNPLQNNFEPKQPNRLSQTVQVQSYTDSHRWSNNNINRATSELECQYQFQDDDEDDQLLPGNDTQQQTKIITVIPPNQENGNDSSMNESSLERLNYRGEPRNSGGFGSGEATDRKLDGKDRKKKDGPLFSIGEYKPLNKPQLKIL